MNKSTCSRSLLRTVAVAVGIVALAGCASTNPVPSSDFDVTIAGQKFKGHFPKDTTMTNVVAEVGTNGTARFSIGYLSAVNNSNVIGTSYAGRADELKAVADGVLNGLNAGATIAGKFTGAAVKTP